MAQRSFCKMIPNALFINTGRFAPAVLPRPFCLAVLWIYSSCYYPDLMGFKRTRSCTYIPWSADLPVLTESSWIGGGYIRYLGVCSREHFYTLCPGVGVTEGSTGLLRFAKGTPNQKPPKTFKGAS